jgi:hypothetical protein
MLQDMFFFQAPIRWSMFFPRVRRECHAYSASSELFTAVKITFTLRVTHFRVSQMPSPS